MTPTTEASTMEVCRCLSDRGISALHKHAHRTITSIPCRICSGNICQICIFPLRHPSISLSFLFYTRPFLCPSSPDLSQEKMGERPTACVRASTWAFHWLRGHRGEDRGRKTWWFGREVFWKGAGLQKGNMFIWNAYPYLNCWNHFRVICVVDS